jgi:two-component system CheB/CheR fusion protein
MITTPKKIEKSPMIILGASAGGLENFSTVLAKISPKNNFIYVLIQHLDPKHKSHLASLLKKTTTLPVEAIVDGMKPEINHIYVVPSNVEMRWVKGAFKLSPRTKGKNEHCSIDVFLESVCKDKERKLLGILLSGSNSDGTKGFKCFKKAGASTVAIDPATTYFPIMPQSAINHKVVDKVLPLEKIAAEINKLAKQVDLINKQEKEDVFIPILDILEKMTGVDFSQYKQATLHRRITRRMQLNKISTLNDYLKLLKKNPTELKKLFEEVTIHVTNFFRDSDSFDSLQKKVFPKVFNITSKEPVRVWVPACSTGQEAYSIAMLMMEYNVAARSKIQIQVFATDVSEDSIKKARTGIYTIDETANIPEKLLNKYFEKINTGYKVTKDLRNSCVFAKHDLTRDASFSQMDLICCRNLLIYFNQNNQKKSVHTFNYALKPNGYLFLGHEESLGSMEKLFTVVDRKNSIFKKSELHSISPNVKSPITQNVRSWETKRGTPFLSKADHEEFLKIAKNFNIHKTVK